MESRGAVRSLSALLTSMPVQRISRCVPLLAAALLATACSAQVIGDPGTLQDGRHIPFPLGQQNVPETTARPPVSPQPQASTAVQPTAMPGPAPAATAPSLLDKPAQPAIVTLSGGRLSVTADNSSLTEILHQLASASGMTIDGLDKDTRVFGTYGPGDPRDILGSLLDGAGYNVMMVGGTVSGTPRQLVLSARSDAPAVTAQTSSRRTVEQDDDADEAVPMNNYPPAGEIEAHPPATQAEPAQNPNGTPRTPQQMLQDLQMRQRTQQQPDQQSTPQ
jgi:hypothetical protein